MDGGLGDLGKKMVEAAEAKSAKARRDIDERMKPFTFGLGDDPKPYDAEAHRRAIKENRRDLDSTVGDNSATQKIITEGKVITGEWQRVPPEKKGPRVGDSL